jgi:ParB/RepB/Spo0J family partition protein
MAKKPSAADIAESLRASVNRTASTTLHPMRPGLSSREQRDSTFFELDPHRIVEEGDYVREPDVDDPEWERWIEAVRERGQIDQPISVRTRGPATARTYILVYGRRRLHAARALGFAKVPVRSYGELSDDESYLLQMQENESRLDHDPVTRSLGLARLVAGGKGINELARMLGLSKNLVSVCARAGAALRALPPETVERLRPRGRLHIRDLQEIVKLPEEERVDALAALAAARTAAPYPEFPDDEDATSGGDSPRGDAESADARPADGAVAGQSAEAGAARSNRDPVSTVGFPRRPRPAVAPRSGPTAAFMAKSLAGGGGRLLKVRWTPRDLQRDPEAYLEQFATFVRAEYDRLVAQIEALQRGTPTLDAAATEQLARARAAAKRIGRGLPGGSARVSKRAGAADN